MKPCWNSMGSWGNAYGYRGHNGKSGESLSTLEFHSIKVYKGYKCTMKICGVYTQLAIISLDNFNSFKLNDRNI